MPALPLVPTGCPRRAERGIAAATVSAAFWPDEPDAGTARALDEAVVDLDAGRSVLCASEGAFDALLDALTTDPGVNTRAS
ncbi:hypothetical protein [Frankia sp. EAN1pec]|uniref:hypothetical protein n=1 Tax=Parafrankia sp. (strain EAN1pec) TaxID=298653 RepID=UPI0002E0978F